MALKNALKKGFLEMKASEYADTQDDDEFVADVKIFYERCISRIKLSQYLYVHINVFLLFISGRFSSTSRLQNATKNFSFVKKK